MSIDYTAVLCYGYKLTPEEVAAVGVERLQDIKAEYEMEPHPYGLICSDDFSDNATWYVGRWIEESTVEYYADDFNSIEERDFASINLLMDHIFGKEFYVETRQDSSTPTWHLFTRCW